MAPITHSHFPLKQSSPLTRRYISTSPNPLPLSSVGIAAIIISSVIFFLIICCACAKGGAGSNNNSGPTPYNTNLANPGMPPARVLQNKYQNQRQRRPSEEARRNVQDVEEYIVLQAMRESELEVGQVQRPPPVYDASSHVDGTGREGGGGFGLGENGLPPAYLR